MLYLVHSIDGDDFRDKDRQAAHEMARACEQNRVHRIVYLAGLIPDDYTSLSEHLRSRLEVEEIFLAARLDATVLRAAIILGSGSTSFELIRHMIERLPLTPLPAWMNHRVQPIAVGDVLAVVAAALDEEISRPGSFDIGGPTVMSYPQLLATYARVAGLRRPGIPLPPLPRTAVGRAVAAIAQMPTELVTSLVDSLGHEMIVRRGNAAATVFATPSQPPLRTAESAVTESITTRIASAGTDGTTAAEAPAPTDPGLGRRYRGHRRRHRQARLPL